MTSLVDRSVVERAGNVPDQFLLALVVSRGKVVSVVDRTWQIDAHVDATVFCLQVRLIHGQVVALKVGLIVYIVGALVPWILLPLLGCLAGTVPGHLFDALLVCIEFAIFTLQALFVDAFQ